MSKINYNPTSVIRANKIHEINKKYDSHSTASEKKEKVITPWFCPKCKKRTYPIDDYHLVLHNMCLSCHIIEEEKEYLVKIHSKDKGTQT